MNSILFELGFIKIYWYSFLIFIALLIGGSMALKEGKKWGISEDFMINMFFFLIPVAILGARLYYVARLAGLLFVAVYTSMNHVSFARMTDILVVSLILGQAIGRWGNFFNQEAHGPATTLEFLQKIIPFKFIIEGMNIGGTYYQPTFLYESIWCLIGFIVLLIIRRLKYIKIGQITGVYFIWYGVGRFFIESLRTDSLMFNNFKMAQIISIIMVILGIIIVVVKNRGFKLEGQYN